jgi:hypothetical protein
MKTDKPVTVEDYQNASEIEKIGNEGVSRAKEENRKKGIPIVYSINGDILYELPDGTITRKSPFTALVS